MTAPKPPLPETEEAPLEPAAENALVQALRAAYAPAPLAPARHAELLALALEDPFAPPNEEEARASERLRQALDRGDDTHEAAVLARALRAAVNPTPLPPAAERRAARATAPRASVVYVAFGAVALAVAAGFALFLARPSVPAESAAELVPSRSTQELFREPFATGEASARIDRIALARERDARENRYSAWGVR